MDILVLPYIQEDHGYRIYIHSSCHNIYNRDDLLVCLGLPRGRESFSGRRGTILFFHSDQGGLKKTPDPVFNLRAQMAEKITKRSDDYSQWYLDIVQRPGIAEHSDVRGCMVIKPNGYAIWEKMQRALDRMFKDTGHVNAYFPLFIPKSFLLTPH